MKPGRVTTKMFKGVEYTLKNGQKICYDPVDIDTGLAAAGGDYLITVGATTYAIERDQVETLRFYDLCPKCGYELFKDGCRKCM